MSSVLNLDRREIVSSLLIDLQCAVDNLFLLLYSSQVGENIALKGH